jgi:hypothetical protein
VSIKPDAFQPSLDPSRGASAVQNWQQAAALNLLDLELLHNFSTSTCYTLHNDPTLKTLWRINVPQLGLDYDFVMRGILALSALHLAKSRPEHKERYVSLALLHSAAGLRAVTAILPNITKENCSAIYLFSALTFILALATPRKPGDLLIMGNSGPAEWLTLFRGVHVIVQSSQGNIESGILGPMFTSGARRSQLRDAYASEHSTDKDQLGYLRYAIQQTVTNQHILQIYMNTINELQISFTAAYSGVFDALESTDVFIFLFRVSEDYLVLLEDRTQESLAIFAYFAVLAKRLEGNWWCEGWSDYLMSKIYTLLDDEHKLWIRWPMEETGWIPPRETYHK